MIKITLSITEIFINHWKDILMAGFNDRRLKQGIFTRNAIFTLSPLVPVCFEMHSTTTQLDHARCVIE